MDVNLDHVLQNFILVFTSIVWEAMPFIILGAVIAGVLEEMVPQQLVARVIPRSRVLAIAIGGFLGLLFPMCECGIIPVMRRLLRKGVPLSCCVCYLLAGPIINVVVMLSTFVAFSGMENLTTSSGQPAHQWGGFQMMPLRMAFGYLVAFGTSLIVEWQHRKYGSKLLAPLAIADTTAALSKSEGENGSPAPPRPWAQRIENISSTALHDFVDITVFLILGALLAALSRVLIDHDQVDNWPHVPPALAVFVQPAVKILIMMGLAIVLCICSEADAFVAASYTFMPPASKLAFLVLGPMLDFKLYLMYTRVFRPRLIWTIILSVVLQVFIYTLAVHYAWTWYSTWHTSRGAEPAAATTPAQP